MKLGSLIELKSGKGIDKSKISQHGKYKIYGAVNILGYTDDFLYDRPLISIGRVGAYCGSVTLINEPIWITDNAIVCFPKDSINTRYLYYFLYNKKLNSLSIGAAQPLLTQGIIKDIDISLPPLQYQQKIVDILSPIDEKIELNNKINKTLEDIAQLLYKQWFIDFEFPNQEGKLYKSSGGEMVYNEEFDKEIPKGWKFGKLGDIANFKNGVNYNRDSDGNTKYKVISVKALANDNIIITANLDDVNLNNKYADQYLLEKDDIIVARSASPGEMLYSFEEYDDVIYSGFSIRIKCDDVSYAPYLYETLLYYIRNVQALTDGTTLKNINQKALSNIKILIPSNDIITHYYDSFHLFYNKILKNYKEVDILIQQQNLLLDNYFGG